MFKVDVEISSLKGRPLLINEGPIDGAAMGPDSSKPAAPHADELAGEVTGRLGDQEPHHPGDFLRPAEAPDRDLGHHTRARRGVGATACSISVSMTEGSTALTAMFSRASSRAALAVSASIPALLAA